jgi:hypothetical protein
VKRAATVSPKLVGRLCHTQSKPQIPSPPAPAAVRVISGLYHTARSIEPMDCEGGNKSRDSQMRREIFKVRAERKCAPKRDTVYPA